MAETMQLCGTYAPGIDDVSGWFMSEKFDGQAALWDGKGALLSRDGNMINAPDDWVASLPPIPLHGELWLRRGVGCLHELQGVVSKAVPDADAWRAVKFLAHSAPSPGRTYDQEFTILINTKRAKNGPLQIVGQETLPGCLVLAEERIEQLMAEIEAIGGEGVILRNPNAVWKPGRTTDVLKHKILRCMEGRVIGYVAGKRGRTLGKVGSLVLDIGEGKQVRVGLLFGTDGELPDGMYDWALAHPGKQMPEGTALATFPVGATVDFSYRDLSANGVPLEPRLVWFE